MIILVSDGIESDTQLLKISVLDLLTEDTDEDGLSDEEEIALGTDPHNPDSDGDGFFDGTRWRREPIPRIRTTFLDQNLILPTLHWWQKTMIPMGSVVRWNLMRWGKDLLFCSIRSQRKAGKALLNLGYLNEDDTADSLSESVIGLSGQSTTFGLQTESIEGEQFAR